LTASESQRGVAAHHRGEGGGRRSEGATGTESLPLRITFLNEKEDSRGCPLFSYTVRPSGLWGAVNRIAAEEVALLQKNFLTPRRT
jgi:hypothetical protein